MWLEITCTPGKYAASSNSVDSARKDLDADRSMSGSLSVRDLEVDQVLLVLIER